MSSINQNAYNPDVLSCLANLSNDEVFTPPEVANAMIDLLPQELFSDPNTKFLDPACKSGVFLREIAKRLIKGLEPKIPDLQERVNHIFTKQLYAIAITELTSLLARRSVYCSKDASGKYSVTDFSSSEGNIFFSPAKHLWIDDKCLHCGASKAEYGEEQRKNLETHAYQFIHNAIPEELENMKFDVIIGNPPYQMSDGGNSASAAPIYQHFVEKSMKLKPRYLSLIIPARWYSGGKGLDSFREKMISDKHIRILHDFLNASDCFPGVEIKGGICYFLWNRDNEGTCEITTHVSNDNVSTQNRYMKFGDNDIFIRRNEAIEILAKIQSKKEKPFSDFVSSRKPFGLPTNFEGHLGREKDDITLYQHGGTAYIRPSEILKNKQWVEKSKLYISKAYGASDDWPHQIINKPIFGSKNSCCTETYLVIGPFETEEITNNVMKYIKTQFFRFLVSLIKISQDATQRVYQFVPAQNFSSNSEIDWSKTVGEINQKLFEKYGLVEPETKFIESMIRPME